MVIALQAVNETSIKNRSRLQIKMCLVGAIAPQVSMKVMNESKGVIKIPVT